MSKYFKVMLWTSYWISYHICKCIISSCPTLNDTDFEHWVSVAFLSLNVYIFYAVQQITRNWAAYSNTYLIAHSSIARSHARFSAQGITKIKSRCRQATSHLEPHQSCSNFYSVLIDLLRENKTDATLWGPERHLSATQRMPASPVLKVGVRLSTVT